MYVCMYVYIYIYIYIYIFLGDGEPRAAPAGPEAASNDDQINQMTFGYIFTSYYLDKYLHRIKSGYVVI